MGFLKKFYVVIFLFGLAGFFIYHIHLYDLLGPHEKFNDVTYYYILGASGVLDGSAMPRFDNPGLSFMFMLAWYFFILKRFSIIAAFSMPVILSSPNPFKELLDLFFAGRFLTIGLGLCYLLLIYLISKKIIKSKFIGILFVIYNILMAGAFEHMFIMRPELLSAVCILGVVFTYLYYGEPHRDSFEMHRMLAALFFMGALASLGVMAKVLMMFFLPLLLVVFVDFSKRAGQLNRETYIKYLVPLILLNLTLAWPWSCVFDPAYINSLLSTRNPAWLLPMYYSALILAKVFMGVSVALAALSFLNFNSKKFCSPSMFRKLILFCLAFSAGALVSLGLFFLNEAHFNFEWGRQAVLKALVETLSALRSIIKPADAAIGASLGWSYFFNLQIKYILFSMFSFITVFSFGMYYSERKGRINLLFIGLFMLFLACVFAARGCSFAFMHYQIYFLLTASLLMMVAVPPIIAKIKGRRLAIFLSLAIFTAFATDVFTAARNRADILSQNLDLSVPYPVIGDRIRENYFDPALKARYCNDGMSEKECNEIIGAKFSKEKDLY